ncbi:MAG: DNA-3-methyladenine glycosylase [bacterium]|nr:DNA-3-methyladenine glycosylase [bacterium]
MQLDRDFFARSPLEVAPDLLNKVFVAGPCKGRIVEVEAYGGKNDPASHGHKGMTPRTQVMFGPPGYLYVYFTYGMHWCVNVVCGQKGECAAVLLRALEPLSGLQQMRQRRPKARQDKHLCNGPAKLATAFGIDGSANGVDLVANEVASEQAIHVLHDGTHPPQNPGRSERIGISAATDLKWRYYICNNPNLSR